MKYEVLWIDVTLGRPRTEMVLALVDSLRVAQIVRDALRPFYHHAMTIRLKGTKEYLS